MNKERLTDYFKFSVIFLGTLCFTLALLTLPSHKFSWGYFFLAAFSVFIAPRLGLTLPRSKFTIVFSDAIIFLAFIIYGGEIGILAAFVAMFANGVYFKGKGILSGSWIILFNASLASLVTALSYVVFILLSNFLDASLNPSNTRSIIILLGLLSLTQFIFSSVFAAVYQNFKTGTGIWEIWKNQCLSSSLSQFAGACLAGLVYKLINYADPVVISIASVGLTFIYVSYRQSIREINASIEQAEEAERQKAETERLRRLEAEEHAARLSLSLEQEEKTSAALRKSKLDFKHQALHDSLTNLPNRKKIGDILRSLLDEYKSDPSINFHVLFIDIKRFKQINDSLGHTVGDKVLMIAAKRFLRMLTAADTVARLGGDEFAIILRGLSTVGKAQKVARRIYQSISQPFSLSGTRISIGINIGIAACDAEYNSPQEILRDADIAMHYAKEKESGVAVFTKELRERFQERARLELDLRHAVDRNELSMHYQPIVSLNDGRLVGFEALLRWHRRDMGNIPPNKFIPIAEESGLILPITQWILNETCGQLSRWQEISPAHKILIVSVNISGKHLSTNELIDDVQTALENSSLSPGSLKLEITESAAMENAEHTINMLNKLKTLGVQLSIDDFGTGYSSLSYLHMLPFDTLKIDRTFVYRVGENGENSEVLQTIISLAKNLKMRVIAEGIETESQLSLLQNLGCDYGQGFLLAKPKTAEDAEQLLYKRLNFLPSADHMSLFETTNRVSAEKNLSVF